MSNIAVGGGVGGAIFAIGCTCLFLIGVPFARYFLPGAVPFGFLVALALFVFHKYSPVQFAEVLPPPPEETALIRPNEKGTSPDMPVKN